MVKNLLIARKTYRFRETVGMLIVKKCERPVSSGSYQAVNTRKSFKSGNVVEKSTGMEKRGGKNFKKH